MNMGQEALEKAITEEGRRVIREALDVWRNVKGNPEGMTLVAYQEAAQRTSNTLLYTSKIENGLIGLAGEVGELHDHWKKHSYQGHAFDRRHMIRELGDVLWYVAELACGLGVTLEDVAKANIEKLRKRYPDGFETEKSRERKAGDD